MNRIFLSEWREEQKVSRNINAFVQPASTEASTEPSTRRENLLNILLALANFKNFAVNFISLLAQQQQQ